MPCYSIIQTKLLDLLTIKKAVKDIGAKIIAQSPNTLVIEKDGKRISLDRAREGQNYDLMINRSTRNYETLLNELTVSYAEITLNDWAEANGYTFSRAEESGEYVMVQYA